MWKQIKKINERIAIFCTLNMSTMGCVYVLLLWSLLPLVFPLLQNMVFYVSGGIIQLVALPMIMVGQRLLDRASEARSIKDHQTINKSFSEIKELHVHIDDELSKNTIIREKVESLENKLNDILLILKK